jgi:hypothetical protein
VDDLPPQTIITSVLPQKDGQLLIRGTTADNGDVKRVLVNGYEAKAKSPNHAEWEITLPKTAQLTASAEDAAGNTELRPHVLRSK